MRKALLAGTFDPPSLGHLNLIEKAAKICTHLLIGIGENVDKKSSALLNNEEKIFLLKELTKQIPNIEICEFSGLIANFAKENKIDFLIRGIRNSLDLDFEIQMANANKKLGGIETIFIPADALYSQISSTLIKQLAFFHAQLQEFVPKAVENYIYQKIQKIKRM